MKPQDTDRRIDAQPTQGRGKEWGLPAGKIEQLQSRARTMRNDPTEPEKRLWRILSNGQVDGHKFRRQQVIGWHIVDFVCPAMKLVVEVDGDTHTHEGDRQRDANLAERGYRVVHVTNTDVMANIEGVRRLIAEALVSAENHHTNAAAVQPTTAKRHGLL